jgi:hypothetical protein
VVSADALARHIGQVLHECVLLQLLLLLRLQLALLARVLQEGARGY